MEMGYPAFPLQFQEDSPLAMSTDVKSIDFMPGTPRAGAKPSYDFMQSLLKDEESLGTQDDYIRHALDEMDAHGIERALTGVGLEDKTGQRALNQHPDRFLPSCGVDPNRGIDALRHIERMHDEFGILSASAFPAVCVPQVPIDDKRCYPVCAKCCELDIPKAITDCANTRGADKILCAGYFPMGLSLARIFRGMPHVPFRDEVWPKFLRENALRVLKLEG